MMEWGWLNVDGAFRCRVFPRRPQLIALTRTFHAFLIMTRLCLFVPYLHNPRHALYTCFQITSRVEDAVELIEISSPTGVSPGVCSYLGPPVRLLHH